MLIVMSSAPAPVERVESFKPTACEPASILRLTESLPEPVLMTEPSAPVAEPKV